uniref:Uncharacterized protein n=1 Tax=Oryza meridionalis TaxID=40149 RepID=A0A0E0EC02_9ORYZ
MWQSLMPIYPHIELVMPGDGVGAESLKQEAGGHEEQGEPCHVYCVTSGRGRRTKSW